MACESWRDKIAAYADAELSAGEMRAMGEHIKGCASCASDALSRVQLRSAIKTTGKRFSPSPALGRRIRKELPAKRNWVRLRVWMPQLAATAVLALVCFFLFRGWVSSRQERTIAELADLHVATLASSAPVDVISSDRHTVKPWFQGKIPFTFNLPELGGTAFTLDGGRVSYLEQAPGAQLIFKIGAHRISVFVFQNRGARPFAPGNGRFRSLTFNVETWTEDDLRYFVIGDAEANDIHKLSELLVIAARP